MSYEEINANARPSQLSELLALSGRLFLLQFAFIPLIIVFAGVSNAVFLNLSWSIWSRECSGFSCLGYAALPLMFYGYASSIGPLIFTSLYILWRRQILPKREKIAHLFFSGVITIFLLCLQLFGPFFSPFSLGSYRRLTTKNTFKETQVAQVKANESLTLLKSEVKLCPASGRLLEVQQPIRVINSGKYRLFTHLDSAFGQTFNLTLDGSPLATAPDEAEEKRVMQPSFRSEFEMATGDHNLVILADPTVRKPAELRGSFLFFYQLASQSKYYPLDRPKGEGTGFFSIPISFWDLLDCQKEADLEKIKTQTIEYFNLDDFSQGKNPVGIKREGTGVSLTFSETRSTEPSESDLYRASSLLYDFTLLGSIRSEKRLKNTLLLRESTGDCLAVSIDRLRNGQTKYIFQISDLGRKPSSERGEQLNRCGEFRPPPITNADSIYR